MPEHDLAARHGHAAAAEHPQGAQVQRLGARHEDERAWVQHDHAKALA
jgi:hypothetical protein